MAENDVSSHFPTVNFFLKLSQFQTKKFYKTFHFRRIFLNTVGYSSEEIFKYSENWWHPFFDAQSALNSLKLHVEAILRTNSFTPKEVRVDNIYLCKLQICLSLFG